MHLHVIIAYALLFWRIHDANGEFSVPLVSSGPGVLATVVVQFGLLGLIGWWLSRRALNKAKQTIRRDEAAHLIQHAHHRYQLVLRSAVLILFAFDLAFTTWPTLVLESNLIQAVPGLGAVLLVVPFLGGSVLVMMATFPLDLAVRGRCLKSMTWLEPKAPSAPRVDIETGDGRTRCEASPWTMRRYLDFNVRHQLLAAAGPMTLILIAFDLTRRYESQLVRLLRIPWASDVVMTVVAGCVFLLAPWMLMHIWTTESLTPGAYGGLRGQLDGLCKEIGLRCRDILVWHSGGMIVNAAVMGLIPQLRYVMLSDGLLNSMSTDQVKAVFGHEAGHVRHRHIPFFLLFALASMLVTSGLMELLYVVPRRIDLGFAPDIGTIQVIGFLTVIGIWGLGFGFISRRFERQADLFGARCVGSRADVNCSLPCGVHAGDASQPDAPNEVELDGSGPDRLCATGAAVFTSALDRVATLNGIPQEERSWRHSSIASRIDFLAQLAGDPNRLRSFERGIGRIKTALWLVCVVGIGISIYYLGPSVLADVTRGR